MYRDLLQTLEQWLFDPLTGKVVLLLVGFALIIVVTWLLRGTAARYVHDSATRYKTRKFVTFFGYLATVIFAVLVFSDKLGGFTVAFGVAGAGMAFALQEVIASVAGWMAVSFGGFYKVGRPRAARRHQGRRDRHRRPAHDHDGDRRMGERRPVQRPYRARGQQLRLQGAGVQLLGRASRFCGTRSWSRSNTAAIAHWRASIIGRVAEEVVGDYVRAAERAWGRSRGAT